ncbi:putative transmembrane sensor domain protein [Legionella massiliensis]|uniref:Putative transmembrane sensor domain protein n=1 Tax=Legionella massiliensis TaxID=1034943 RepID=A0A078KS76_9GAMM|nr:hypothetical protein [Legionella massiliensis]CDZ77320.1 putative transmembrane sensor domain protein [Legionella massiliensis]CEE13058.1 hypothetical protein BN1094_01603 [Legionella massiliensis]
MTYKKEELTIAIEEPATKSLPAQLLETTNRIKAHREQADLYTADMDLQRKRFDVEKSTFGKVAARFWGLPWWAKGLIALTIGGVAALIGLAFSIAWVITLPIIALSLYGAIAYIFYDYTQSDEKRFTQLSEGLVQREEEMKQSILELQQAEEELFTLIGQLREFEQANAEVVDTYNAQAQILDEKVKRYEAAVLQFEQLKAAFSAHTETMQTIETEFSESFRQITDSLSQQAERINCNTEELEQSTLRFKIDIAELKDDVQPLRVEEGRSISSRFEQLTDGFVERTEVERQQEQENFAKADLFLDETDAFLLEMGAFLTKHQPVLQPCLVAKDSQVQANNYKLN